MDILIIGGGISGLTLALMLHEKGIPCRLYEAVAEVVFYHRFGQLIHGEPLGKFAGYAHPQFSIHRGDLHAELLGAVRQRLGEDRVRLGWRCTGFTQDEAGVTVDFEDFTTGEKLASQRGAAAIACDGLHSALRKQLHPSEGEPRYSGVNMWRGVTRMKPILSAASHSSVTPRTRWCRAAQTVRARRSWMGARWRTCWARIKARYGIP